MFNAVENAEKSERASERVSLSSQEKKKEASFQRFSRSVGLSSSPLSSSSN